MKVVDVEAITRLPEQTVVCLGFFDGVHIGHQRLIAKAKEIGTENRLKVCVHTFDQMPARVLHPDWQVTELTPLAEKTAILESLGVDVLAVSAFAQAQSMLADAFFHEILLEKLQARYIVAGFHHHFGYRGEADVAQLRRLCAQTGIGLDVIEPVKLDGGELVSSTAIRQALARGDTEKASQMLGRPCASD